MERYDNLSKLTSLLGFYQTTKTNGDISANEPALGNNLLPAKGPVVTDPKMKSAQSVITDKITAGPDGKTAMPASQNALATDMMKLLHRDDWGAVGGAICKIPAMELGSPDEEDSPAHSVGADIMPSLGQSHNDIAMRDAQNISPNPDNVPLVPNPSAPAAEKPLMAASVLHMMANTNSSSVVSNGNGSAGLHGNGNGTLIATVAAPPARQTVTLAPPQSVPESFLVSASKKDLAEETSSSSANSTKLEMAATVNMGRPLSFTRTSSPHAPAALIRSLFSSFSTLVNSRVRTWTLLLLRHSLSSGDENSRNNLMSLLASHHSYEMKAMITEFDVEEATDEMKIKLIQEGQARREARKIAQLNQQSGLGMDFCDLILPFEFKATIDITVQDHQVTVNLNAPGSIGAIFQEDSSLVSFMECKIDTNTLIKSMIEQARLVVFQFVARATSSIRQAVDKAGPPPLKENPPLSTLGSKLSLTSSSDGSSQSSVALSKASRNGASSSAAVISLLKRPGLRGVTSNRSVQWDHKVRGLGRSQTATHQSSGKKRSFPTLGGSSLKRSTKSFGKPGSDIFRSSRNATFAEFGNAGQSPHVKTTTGNSLKNSHTLSRYHVSTHTLQRNGNEAANQSNGNGLTNAFFSPGSVKPGNWNKKKPSFHELARSAVYSVTPPASGSSLLNLQGMNSATGALKRTPTQLESLLLCSQTKRKTKRDEFRR